MINPLICLQNSHIRPYAKSESP